MRKFQGGNATTYLLMCVATVGVTAGVALALYTGAERTPSFVLSLVMLCFAEVVLFAFPSYHARSSTDRSTPAFTFGFGFQAALVLYALGVLLLCLLSGTGTLSYSLVDRPALGTGISLRDARASGGDVSTTGFNGLQHTALARNRALPAGMQDTFELEATIQADPGVAATFAACVAGHTTFLSSTELEGDVGRASSQECLGTTVSVTRLGDLEIRKTLLTPPTARPNTSSLFDLKYRIEVHNTRWFPSFSTLAIAHAVLFLMLLLIAGFWRMGSAVATGNAGLAKSQRQGFLQVRAKLATFAANVALDHSPSMKTFLAAVKSLNDDVAHATPETLPGTERYNEVLTAALERLGAEYGRVRAQLVATTDGSESLEAAVQALVENVRAMANLVRERDAAIRAAR